MDYDESDARPNTTEYSATQSPSTDRIRCYNDVKELLYYNSSRNKHMYIFNHKEYQQTRYFRFKTPPARIGTERDVGRLTSLFQKLGYEIHVNHNLTYKEIMDIIVKVSSEDHNDTSCLYFVVLTHGDRGGELYAADRPYQLDDLTGPLVHGHPSLVGKPKIFFIQACRGKLNDEGRRLEFDSGSAAVTISSYADFLLLRSTVEDYVSYRNINGSFMIQELCDVVEQHHATLDLLHITTLVQRNVCYERATYAPANPQIHDKKQIPETRHTLTKILML